MLRLAHMPKTLRTQNADALVDILIRHVGKRIIVGSPLGIGKANLLLNALYARALKDPEIHLELLTGLTLERPKGKSLLERRFIDLFSNRLFGNYPDLQIELDRVQRKLPPNVKFIEFFFAPGKFLHNPYAQKHYISSNYTHAARDMFDRGVNVVVQMISEKEGTYSLSSNPDVTMILASFMKASLVLQRCS